MVLLANRNERFPIAVKVSRRHRALRRIVCAKKHIVHRRLGSGPGCLARDKGVVSLNENSLSRIPFRVRDELVILSMARWMRFIGVIKMVVGLFLGFIVLVGLIFVGAELSSGVGLSALGKAGGVISDNPVTFFALGIFALLLAGAGTVLGVVLCHAADDFECVARSDVADQDYITAGVSQLNTYFKVSILLGVAAALVGITTAMALIAKIST
jgi:hypothetical protein